MDERLRRLAHNLVGLSLGKGAGLVASLLAVPIVVNALGPAGFGMWAVCQMLVTWTQAMDLGLGAGLQNEISHADNDTQRQLAARSAGALRSTMFAMATVLLLLGLGLIWYWPGILAVFGPDIADYAALGRFLLSCTVISMAAVLLAQTLLRTASGLELGGKVGIAQGIGTLVGLGSLGLFSYFSMPLIGVAVFMLLPVCAQAFAARIYLTSSSFAWAKPDTSWKASDWRRLMSAGIWFLTSQAAGIIIFQTDAIIVSIYLGSVEAGTYQATARLFALIIMGQGVLLAALWPAIARAYAHREISWVINTYRRALLIMACLIALAVLVASISPWLVSKWTTDDELRPSLLLGLGCGLSCVASLWANLHATCLNAVGRLRKPAFIALLQAGLNYP